MIELAYVGFDTLDFALQGALPASVLEAMEDAKEAANKNQEDTLLHAGSGDVAMHVAGYGTKNGYSFITDTGPLGAKWMIRKNTNPNQWNIFVSPRATMLLSYGYRETIDRLWQEFADMGGVIVGHAINRVDFAMDFKMQSFELHSDQFVAPANTTVVPYYGAKVIPDDPNQPAMVFRGRRLQSVTVGRQPHRQIIVYDKRAEAIARQKPFWFKAWGIDPKDRSFDVWRVEVRSGKKELKNKYRMSQFSDFDASIGDVIVNSLNTVRYLADHQSDSNVTRQMLHPLWREAQAIAESNLLDLRSGLTPGQVREVIRKQQIEIYWQQIQGNAAGLSVALGMEDSGIAGSFTKLVGDTLLERLSAEGSRFWKSRKNAASRMVFL